MKIRSGFVSNSSSSSFVVISKEPLSVIKPGTYYMLKWIREFQDALADRAELPTLDAHELQQIDTSDISVELVQASFTLLRYIERLNYLKEASYSGSCL